MREDSYNAPKWFVLLLIGLLTGLTSCVTDQPTNVGAPAGYDSHVFADTTKTNNNEVIPPAPSQGTFKAGDSIKIEFSADDLELIETEVKHDGTVALKLVDRVTVTDKSPREVEKEIKELYVPRYYKRLTVTVTPGTRFFIVGGEVKQAGRIPYSGKITLVGAIQAAGGFGTFADRKRVQVTRASGERVIINYNDVLKNSSLDVEILPGDKINVPEGLL